VSTRYGLVTAVWPYRGLPDFQKIWSKLMSQISWDPITPSTNFGKLYRRYGIILHQRKLRTTLEG
jgi:hypothetical protein